MRGTYTYTIAFSARLNSLQVDKVNIENYSLSFRQTHFVTSKLIAACSSLVLTSEYATTLQTSTSYVHVYAIAFSAGINGLQVENDTELEEVTIYEDFTCTQLVPSKLHHSLHVTRRFGIVWVWPDYTCHARNIQQIKIQLNLMILRRIYIKENMNYR